MTLLTDLYNGKARVSIPDGSLQIQYDLETSISGNPTQGDEVEIIGELRGIAKQCICGYTSDQVIMHCTSIKKVKKGESIW